MTNPFAEKLITNPSKETIDELFENENEGIFWVDWRGADEEIIADTASALGIDELLMPVWTDDKLYIVYRENRSLVPLNFVPHEQDKTLLALNKALSPDFEIRYLRASEGGDTIAFIALTTEEWTSLQQRYGSRVDTTYQALSADNPLFGP